MKKFIALFAVSIAAFSAAATLRLPSVIDDNMVLKRNSDVTLWGWDNASSSVAVIASWNPSDTVRATCNAFAKWELSLKTPDAGGPYTITVIGTTTEVLKNILIGEVWLCSGQSNMDWCFDYGGLKDRDTEVANASHPEIRIFKAQNIASSYPQDDCYGDWVECSSETMPSRSATAYFFARKLQKELGIPVGIIVSAWGGTPAEVWVPEEKINADNTLKEGAEKSEATPWWPKKSGVCFNTMIAPLTPFSISGAIWYQGESNINHYGSYDKLMRTLIGSWRERFKTDFPFYFVQIAPFAGYGTPTDAPRLREQQQKSAEYDKCGMVVINDLVADVNNIHPNNKVDVGERLATLALNKTYGKSNYDCTYPKIRSVIPTGKTIRIKTDCQTQLLAPTGGFEIADQTGKFVPATATQEKKSGDIILSSKSIQSPVFVRYLFNNAALCTVKSATGLPMQPFRNDDFEY